MIYTTLTSCTPASTGHSRRGHSSTEYMALQELGTARTLPVVRAPLHLQGVAHVDGKGFQLPFRSSRSPAGHSLDVSQLPESVHPLPLCTRGTGMLHQEECHLPLLQFR